MIELSVLKNKIVKLTRFTPSPEERHSQGDVYNPLVFKTIIMENKMPKMKTNRGAAKRFRKRANGTYKCKQSHLRHILTKKSSKRKRHLRAGDVVEKVDTPMVRRMLPYV